MKKEWLVKILVLSIIILMLMSSFILVVQAISNSNINSDEPIIEIIRPENGYIYIFDHKTVPYGFPLILRPHQTSLKNAYTLGRPTITIKVNAKQGYIVDYISFKVVERKLFGKEVKVAEYKDYEEPFEFKFTRVTIFPYLNYNVYVDAFDTEMNIVGSDSIGLGYYRVYPQILLFLIVTEFSLKNI